MVRWSWGMVSTVNVPADGSAGNRGVSL